MGKGKGKGWRRMLPFRGARASNNKAPSECGGASATSTPTNSHRDSDRDRGGEVVLEWQVPSPAGTWHSRSRTPPPLSKLKKSLSSFFQSPSSSSSTPSSPKSPSPFSSFFRSSVLSISSSKSKCEKCGGGGGGSTKRGCPVCSSPSSTTNDFTTNHPSMHRHHMPARKPAAAVNYRAYNDDEPLSLSNVTSARSPSGGSHRGGGSMTPPPAAFNPIPEADEEEFDNGTGDTYDLVERVDEQHQMQINNRSNISISVMPEAALVSSGRRHTSYVVAVRVRAPPARSVTEAASRAPMDLVAVLEVSPEMTPDKLQTLKQTIRPVIASMSPADRLSIVAFSGGVTKRLMPLSRMTRPGQRAARQIVDRLVVCSPAARHGQTVVPASSPTDALKKAKRVLEERRECNPVATIMLLSHKHLDQDHEHQNPPPPQHDTTKFVHLEVSSDEHEKITGDKEEKEDALMKCVGGLRSVVMRDVSVQFVLPSGEGEVTAVYRHSPNTSSAGTISCTGGTGSSISLGDLYVGQEVDLLLELRVPLNRARRHPLSFCTKCTYRDPATLMVFTGVEQPPVLLPPVPAQNSSCLRLRNRFVAFRAVVESRRLVGLNDLSTALHLLYSARGLLLQCPPSTAQDLIPTVEAELAEIQRRRGGIQNSQNNYNININYNRQQQEVPAGSPSGGREPLTPTSAWRAAEQLAKVAIMRKSQNRVSDLHGFENARF